MHIHLLWVIHKKWPYVMFAQYKANKKIMHNNNNTIFLFFRKILYPIWKVTTKMAPQLPLFKIIQAIIFVVIFSVKNNLKTNSYVAKNWRYIY